MYNIVGEGSLKIVSREEWGAKPPTATEVMKNPVTHVIIHHTYIPPACTSAADCEASMRAIQTMHQTGNGWADIGYSFGIGGDGRAYEGRGWSKVGAHAPGYNNRSIGIVLIGDWTISLPPPEQLEMAKRVIEKGVDEGFIVKDYILLGHRQTRPTECPGQALWEEIITWPHHSPFPPPVEQDQQNNIAL